MAYGGVLGAVELLFAGRALLVARKHLVKYRRSAQAADLIDPDFAKVHDAPFPFLIRSWLQRSLAGIGGPHLLDQRRIDRKSLLHDVLDEVRRDKLDDES